MRQRLLCIASAVLLVACAAPTEAQVVLPPEEGGEVISIGQPPLWKPYGGGSLGSYYPGDASDMTAYVDLGVDKDLMNPVVGGLVLGGEASLYNMVGSPNMDYRSMLTDGRLLS